MVSPAPGAVAPVDACAPRPAAVDVPLVRSCPDIKSSPLRQRGRRRYCLARLLVEANIGARLVDGTLRLKTEKLSGVMYLPRPQRPRHIFGQEHPALAQAISYPPLHPQWSRRCAACVSGSHPRCSSSTCQLPHIPHMGRALALDASFSLPGKERPVWKNRANAGSASSHRGCACCGPSLRPIDLSGRRRGTW